MTSSAIESASRSMAASLQRDMVPALAGALTDPRMATAMKQTTQSMGHDMIIGINQALIEINRNQGDQSILSNLSHATEKGLNVARLSAIAATAVSVLLALGVVFLLVRTRRAKALSERNAADAIMLAEAIRAMEGQPGSEQLVDLVRKQLKHPEDSDPLEVMLERLRTTSRKNRRDRDDDDRRNGGYGRLAARLQRPSHA